MTVFFDALQAWYCLIFDRPYDCGFGDQDPFSAFAVLIQPWFICVSFLPPPWFVEPQDSQIPF